MTTTPTSSTGSTSPIPLSPASMANQAGNNFCLFNEDWLLLQNFVTATLALPLASTTDFTASYGTFTDMNDVQNCISSLNQVTALAKVMGSPTELQTKIAQNPAYVSGNTMPTEIYAQSIWLAGQLMTTAQNFTSNYGSLSYLFQPPATQAQITANIVEFLTGAGGMVSMAQTALTQVEAVQNSLSSFQTSFKPAMNAVVNYFNQSSNVLTDAQSNYNTDVQQIAALNKQASAAHTAWAGYTAGAVAGSVGIMVVSAGLLFPLAAAIGGALGYEAPKALNTYNSDMAQIATLTTDEQQKYQLVTDLTSFNTSLAQVDTYLTGFANQLSLVQGVWTNQITQLTNLANYVQNNDFSTFTQMNAKFKILDAQNDWQAVATLTSQFTVDCLVNYLNTVKFPQQVPATTAAGSTT